MWMRAKPAWCRGEVEPWGWAGGRGLRTGGKKEGRSLEARLGFFNLGMYQGAASACQPQGLRARPLPYPGGPGPRTAEHWSWVEAWRPLTRLILELGNGDVERESDLFQLTLPMTHSGWSLGYCSFFPLNHLV